MVVKRARNLAVIVEKEGAVGEEGPVVVLVELRVPDNHSHLVPKRARMSGSYTFVSLNARLESNKEEEKTQPAPRAHRVTCPLPNKEQTT